MAEIRLGIGSVGVTGVWRTREKLDFMNHEAHPRHLSSKIGSQGASSWLKETTGPSGVARGRLYESLVTVPRRGDLLEFKINGAGFAILASPIFAALTSADGSGPDEWRTKARGKQEHVGTGGRKKIRMRIGWVGVSRKLGRGKIRGQ